jgi:hypothetical protein
VTLSSKYLDVDFFVSDEVVDDLVVEAVVLLTVEEEIFTLEVVELLLVGLAVVDLAWRQIQDVGSWRSYIRCLAAGRAATLLLASG